MPTIRDVARQAGVGIGTVSRVLNGGGSVKADTRDRVLGAIERLGYRPSPAARALSRGRATTIGVTAPFLTRPSVVERLRGVIEGLQGSDYDVGFASVETPEQRGRRFADLCQRHRVDGAILISLAPTREEISQLIAETVPTITVDAAAQGLPSIVIDNVQGGMIATRHLVELGHRWIGFIGDDPDRRFKFTSGKDRLAGYRKAMAEAGLETDRTLVALEPYGLKNAAEAAKRMLALPAPPTAIFAASDQLALGVIEAARSMGVSIPSELSVIGFDDIELAGFVGLTTVRQPLFESGLHAAELLLRMLGTVPEQVDDVTQLELELVTRQTTDRPRSRVPRRRSAPTRRSSLDDHTPIHDSED